jgi:ribose 1,5-bisphosphokinase PhnN
MKEIMIIVAAKLEWLRERLDERGKRNSELTEFCGSIASRILQAEHMLKDAAKDDD